MLKKIFCVLLSLLLITVGCFIGGTVVKKYTESAQNNSQLREVQTVYDKYDNLLQQILYNENTGEYFLKEYTYSLQNKKWVCTDQKTTIIKSKNVNFPDRSPQNLMLSIYYHNDLFNQPIILMDNSDVKISVIKYLAADNWWDFGYELKIENKTNKVLTILVDKASIMNIECKPLFSVEHVDAGHTAYFTVAWDRDSLERSHIPYIDNVGFMLRVFDNENWKTPALAGINVLFKN